MQCLFQNQDINVRRDCVLRCLSIYLCEDLDTLVKEYVVGKYVIFLSFVPDVINFPLGAPDNMWCS